LLHNLGICQHLSSFRNSKFPTALIFSQETIAFRRVVAVMAAMAMVALVMVKRGTSLTN
jgi:hypothetical protein